MIKLAQVGQWDVAKINPLLTDTSAVSNYDFITKDDKLYLIINDVNNDDWGKEDLSFAAGEYLNGYQVDAFDGQELVVDAKHINFGSGETYAASITAGTTLFTVDSTTHKIAIAASAPASGVYFKCTAKCRLTENAIKVRVLVA